MELLIFSLLTFFLLTFFLSTRAKRNKKLNEQLDKEIESKKIELANLKKRTVDKSTDLTVFQMDALDIYVNSNIRIPADIIEELYYSEIYDFEEIIRFIENQRIQWKLENSKKVFLKKVK